MKIMIVDDHAMVSDGIESLIRSFMPQAQCQKISRSAQAQSALRRVPFDMAVFDIGLAEGMTGLELLQDLRSYEGPNTHTPVLIMSARDDQRNIQLAYRCGANAFLSKATTDMAELKKALVATAQGGTYTPAHAAQQFMGEIPTERNWDHFRLVEEIRTWTDRQRETGLHKYQGLTDRAIALRMKISEGVARKHVEVVYRKLGLTKRAQFMTLLGEHAVKQGVFAASRDSTA